MSKRSIATVALCAALLFAGTRGGSAQPAGSDGSAQPGAAAESAGDSTVVEGEIPRSLQGRWLLAAEASPSTSGQQVGSGGTVVLRTFEIKEASGGLEFFLQRGALSEDLKRRIDPRALARKASAAASPGAATGAAPPASQKPDAATMADLVRAWPSLAQGGEARTVTTQLHAYENVSEEDKERYGAPGTDFLFTIDEAYKAGGAAKPIKSVTVLAVQEIEADKFSGKYLQALVLPGQHRGDISFPPVPVALEGRFVAYRVPGDGGAAPAAAPAAAQAAAPAPAPAASTAPAATPQPPAAAKPKGFLDIFSGCGGS